MAAFDNRGNEKLSMAIDDLHNIQVDGHKRKSSNHRNKSRRKNEKRQRYQSESPLPDTRTAASPSPFGEDSDDMNFADDIANIAHQISIRQPLNILGTAGSDTASINGDYDANLNSFRPRGDSIRSDDNPFKIKNDSQNTKRNIDDVITLTLPPDNHIYNVIDECVYTIINTWDPIDIVQKTSLDVESELILNLCDSYEELLDFFFNSSHEICSVIHQISCKIHSMRILLEGTKIIHIPNSLPEFQKTFSALSEVNISTMRDPNGSIRSGNSLNSSVDEKENNNYNNNNSPKIKKKRSRKNRGRRTNKEKQKIASELKKSMRKLVFQNPRDYLDYRSKLNKQRIKKEAYRSKLKQGMNDTASSGDSRVSISGGDSPVSVEREMTPMNTGNRSGFNLKRAQSKRNKKTKHPTVLCEGCGAIMDMNDTLLQETVIAYQVLCVDSTYFFHDQYCVNFRKYKEIIRKYVSESTLPNKKRSKNIPKYIRNLLTNFNNLITIHSNNSYPRPINPCNDLNDENSSFRFSFLAKGASLKTKLEKTISHGGSSQQRVQPKSDKTKEAFVSNLAKERQLSCLLICRERVNSNESGDGVGVAIVNRFADIPLALQYCDCRVYGISLWKYIMDQLLTKQMESLWLLLAYLSQRIMTSEAIDLLASHEADMGKVKNLDNLEVVCSSIIEHSVYPIATSLMLSNFILSVSESDLSRKEQFVEMASGYTLVAERLVESVESDHLLSLLLEVATDLNNLSVFEIAIQFEMFDFFDNNRVDRIMGHMWSEFDFLNPSKGSFRTCDIDLYQLLRFLMKKPGSFYYSPVGRYWISSSMYIAYVVLVTVVCEKKDYLYNPLSLAEWTMWVCNVGYILYELMEMTFVGYAGYFADSTNYFDMAIMCNWAVLFGLRFFVDSSEHATSKEARNSTPTIIYMCVFGIQICVLYCRISTIFARSKTLGPFIRIIGGMVDDIINFAFVCIIFFTGFLMAFRYVIANDISGKCGSELDMNTFFEITIYVFATFIGQQEWGTMDANPECFNETRHTIAVMFILVFSIMGSVLLLNLLIAMMATTYEDKADAKSREVNFARTEEIYQLAHRQAIIPPPLNIFVFVASIVWMLIEMCIYVVSCCRYMVNLDAFKPFEIDYKKKHDLMRSHGHKQEAIAVSTLRNNTLVFGDGTDDDDDDGQNNGQNGGKSNGKDGETVCCGIFAKRRKSHDDLHKNKYCQFCRYYMHDNNGDISEYLEMFSGYRLDQEDVSIIKKMFIGRGLCTKCYRPFKLFADGSSNRLARWQVIIEIISFYVFCTFVYIPLIILVCLPALFVGAKSFITALADSNKHIRSANIPNSIKSFEQNVNYINLVRKVINEQTTDEFEKLDQKIQDLSDICLNNNRSNYDGNDKYVELNAMIAQLSKQINGISAAINRMQKALQ